MCIRDRKYNVNLEVVSSFDRVPGNKVKEANKMEKMLVKGVAKDCDIARISLVAIPDTPGIAFQIFSALAAKKINVDIILQSIGRDGKKMCIRDRRRAPDESLRADCRGGRRARRIWRAPARAGRADCDRAARAPR